MAQLENTWLSSKSKLVFVYRGTTSFQLVNKDAASQLQMLLAAFLVHS